MQKRICVSRPRCLLIERMLFTTMAVPDGHHDSMFGPQGHHWLRHDGLTRHQGQPEPLRDRDQRQRPFHLGKMLANTDTRTTTEGEIGKLRPSFLRLLAEPFRVKLLWIRKETRISLHDVLAEVELRSRRDCHATRERVFVSNHPDKDPCGWVEPHGFRQNHSHVPEFWKIF